ncbi:MAG TPA: error-prone DNA polymerase [Burkholderiales bacterium]|nr:error-prone DNA polymerase [Burkholderiales bacterium]
MLPDYAELHCLSNFSFLRGASHPEELAERAFVLGYSAIAITDECSIAGVVRAHIAVKTLNEKNKDPSKPPLRLIVGTEVTLEDGPKLVLLAADRAGYGAMCALITRARMRTQKGQYRLERADFDAGVPGCLVLLVPGASPDADHARFVAQRFPGRAWIATELVYGENDAARLAALRELSRTSGLPLVAAGDVHMHVRSRRPVQDVLTAIRLGVTVQTAGTALHPNAERHLRTRLRLAQIYPPELVAETAHIAERCTFDLDTLRYEYPAELVPQGETAASHLRKLTQAGLTRRFPQGAPEELRRLVDHELELIASLQYEHFFLTVNDVVAYARDHDILCQGRGSAANSAVCYCLGITEIDPARMHGLFERFISRERNEPPDIDVDFEHQRREEVIQYVYRKYGRDRAAIAATVICYRPRSAVRDVGKALGLALVQVDRLAKSLAWWDSRHAVPERLREAGFDPESLVMRQLVEIVGTIIGFPRHLSQHTGGFVISRGALAELVPIENAAMPERSVIQWDKDDLEALKLLKVDVLALGMLSVIRRALEFIDPLKKPAQTMPDIINRGDDPHVFAAIRAADTIGVFQIESRAQMSMLPRLKPERFYDLVIEIAIVRPGPIQGGMVHPYLKRRQGLEPVSYPTPQVKQVLERTLGVPIFQEQVMQLAMVAANFSAGEADQLRRAMAAWKRKGGLEPFEARLREGMLANGYTEEFAERVFQQICGFGEYGFPESHSASFALLAYVSAWIKHYEPAAFLAALLNSQPMGFYPPSVLVQDAQRHGVEVRPPDVTVSAWDCTLERDSPGAKPAVRLGLGILKGLSEAGAKRIVSARETAQFETVSDLARRAALNRGDLAKLAASGALATLAGHRRNAHWLIAAPAAEPHLLRDAPVQERLPFFAQPTEADDIVADYRSLGLTLGRHPLALLRGRLTQMRLASAAELKALPDGKPAKTAGIVTCRQRPGTAQGVIFVTLEDETGYTNVVVWNDLVERQRRELLGARLLGVEGYMQKEGGVIHLVARRLVDHSRLLGRLVTESRDFH